MHSECRPVEFALLVCPLMPRERGHFPLRGGRATGPAAVDHAALSQRGRHCNTPGTLPWILDALHDGQVVRRLHRARGDIVFLSNGLPYINMCVPV